jgi:hypothetical protein
MNSSGQIAGINAAWSDASHLDSAQYPNDLMNETLALSQRRLPSLLDVEMLRSLSGLSAVPTLDGPPVDQNDIDRFFRLAQPS